MKNKIIVSIILPCYNVGDLVRKSYDSICSQTMENWEAIFVDDGSTDNTHEELLKLEQLDNRVKILFQNNEGSGSARNKGINDSNGKYLYFMDPDDELYEITLETLVDKAEKSEAEIVICGYQQVDMVTKKNNKFNFSEVVELRTNSEVKDIYIELNTSRLFNPPWNKLYLKKFWENNKLQFPNVRKGQDALLNMLAFRHLNRLIIIPDCLYHYNIGRIGSAQTTLSDNDFEFFEINQKFEKNLLDYWGEKQNCYFINNLIDFCFMDSIKVYRYVKFKEKGLAEFISIWKNRKSRIEVKRINLIKTMYNKTLFIKLLSMKIPVLNYLIQKKNQNY